MKERPIIFNGEMVRAILDGRKTMTRRVIKPQPPQNIAGLFYIRRMPNRFDGYLPGVFSEPADVPKIKCPHGQPGDRLWVRETWTITDNTATQYCLYKEREGEITHIKWRPSIHMPRWASRITLEITNVRVERLQEITYEDALKEGMELFWDSLYANKPEYQWEANPWVWVIEFKRC